MSKWTAKQIPDQTGRIALITGANSGIGYEAAKALAERGATVVLATRNVARGRAAIQQIQREAPSAQLEWAALDLGDLASVRACADDIRRRFPRLDLLINNAGVMMPPRREQTRDGHELQFGTNHLGHFALTTALLERLEHTAGSRVVNVSSSAQNFGRFELDDLDWTRRRFRRMASYGASKIANMLFTLELQRRLAERGAPTISNACHPGWTATNLQRSSPLARLLNPLFAMRPWQGALPTLYAATSPDAIGGCYYGPDGLGTLRGYPTINKPAKASLDEAAARQLWTRSEEMVTTATT